MQAGVERLAQFQIDSINVVTRAHFMPLFSRLGAYDVSLLARAAHRPPRRLFEYWGHAASLIDVTLQPLLRFRMQDGYRDVWSGVERVARENPDLVDFVREEVAARGPISARELEVDEVRDRSNWGWNWSSVKTVLEWLFYCGEVTSARRNSPVRAGLRPARAGAAAGGARPAHADTGRVGDRPGPAGRPGAGRGQRVLPAGLLPDPTGDDAGRRSPRWWRPVSCCR